MSDTLTRRDIEVALDCLERAVHAGTSDAEALAAIRAWRRKTGQRLVREVCEGHFAQSSAPSRRVQSDGYHAYQRDRRLQTENLALKHEVDNWRREAVKWHEEYQRVFGTLTPKEAKSLYDKIARRQQKAEAAVAAGVVPGGRRRLFRGVNRGREALFAAVCCVAFLALFAAAKWLLFLAQHPARPHG